MKTFKIDVALLIVFLTGLAYGTTYIYQYAFLHHYKLPAMFIDLNTNILTGTLFPLILLILAILMYIAYIMLIIKGKGSFFKSENLWTFLLLFCLMAPFGAFMVGASYAEKKEEYIVIKQNKELFVVLTAYKDNFVIAPLDIKKETIKSKFQTIEMKSAKDSEIIKFEHRIKVDKLRNSKELKKEIK
ncbi:hypothetical protein [Priestia megaterium]|uniref:hypothetical protein n=1 Tax=Priestia megaterium TaxID=1404 RepID=UPI00178061D6|nr:hypothetical protein [Priestia megaterium]MBD8115019.1 hypothetical protein [Priestia megaterium]